MFAISNITIKKHVMKRTALFYRMLLPTAILFIIGILPTSAQQISPTNKLSTFKTSGYAPVNGLKMYYEIHGEGKPIVLLHGSYMTIDMNWGQVIPELAKKHKIIAVEMQGHGRTADIDRPYSWTTLADDVAELLKYLKTDNADILGYSFGATVALEFAIKYPAMINKLVFISSVYKLEGWIKPARDLFPTIKPEFFENTPLKTEYDRLAPDKAHWKDFVKKLAQFDAVPFDLGIENVKKIKCPVLIIKGDNDGVELEHTAEMYKALGGGVFGDMAGLPKSQLMIIPGMTHVTLMMATNQLMPVINPFLDK
jgi:pimeloyl-ACP methyl ester carboxylesterase